MKLKVVLDIEVENETTCGKCKGNINTLPGFDDKPDFCMIFRRSLLRDYNHKLMRIPECIAQNKASK